SGVLENTYVIFTSDNGLFHGEHRIKNGKFLPHEPSTRQPLIMRGPDLPAGRVTTALSSNLSLASTVLSMTGTGASSDLDAGSLIGFARHPRRASQAPVLLEGFNGRDISSPDQFFDGTSLLDPNQALVINYTGLIRENWKYVSYAYGEEELYNLAADPGEMRNLAAWPRYAAITAWGRDEAARLATCVGSECQVAEKAPPLPKRNGG
ncbi:MAG: sulfatase-like hydrolase/transferase, partial [Solirubrobacterales bacterium]